MTHQHQHEHHHAHGPSTAGSVVLQLGGDIGALIIETGPDRLGAEIEISPATGGARTPSMVRERLVDPHPRYHAVYPDLPAGRYLIWQNPESVAAEVEVHGGRITWYTRQS